jgi:Ca2+/H+ antiporter
MTGGNMWMGIAIIIIGVILLLQNLGYVSGTVWGVVLPVFIVAVGLSMIFSGQKKQKREDTSDKDK